MGAFLSNIIIKLFYWFIGTLYLSKVVVLRLIQWFIGTFYLSKVDAAAVGSYRDIALNGL